MTPIQKLLKAKNRLKSVPDTFLEKLKAVQKKQFILLSAKMKELQTKGESISPTRANFLLIEEIRRSMTEELLTGDYKDAVKKFSNEFKEQAKLNNTYFDTISNKYSTEIADTVLLKIQEQTVKSLVSDTINKGFLDPIESVLNNAVASNAGFKETLEYINNFTEGVDGKEGAIAQWSRQLAHDNFANADRAYGSSISDELGLEFYLYAGGEIATTRCFCESRHGKYYHYKEIEAWGRGDNVGECGYPWAGMNRATNETTIFNYAGGYGCMHSISGVEIFGVPKEDVRRNIENGNYTPTEYEKEFFNL